MLIVIILAELPYLNGILMERVIKKSGEDTNNSLNANNPFGYFIEIVKYDRSYLNTDMELKMDLGIPKERGLSSLPLTH